jgi:hypothetical protein
VFQLSRAQQSDAADVPKRHALCKDEEHNARLFSTPLIWALAAKEGDYRADDGGLKS